VLWWVKNFQLQQQFVFWNKDFQSPKFSKNLSIDVYGKSFAGGKINPMPRPRRSDNERYLHTFQTPVNQ